MDEALRVLGGAGAVVFDLDDTLFRSREVKWAHHKATAARFYGIDLSDDDIAPHWGKPFDELITALYRASATVPLMRAANLALEAEFRKTALDGARALVDALVGSGVPVGVVTSANTGPALADLTWLGFPVERLLFVHGADVTEVHKPDPGVFAGGLALLAEVGVRPAEVVYVGDAMMDVVAARGAGFGFVGVATGLVDGPAFAAAGVPWVDSVAALAAAVVTERTPLPPVVRLA